MTSGVPAFVLTSQAKTLPSGHTAVPIHASLAAGPLRLCVIVRSDAKGSSPLVLLRETIDARVLLGCVVDAKNRVQSWLEIWVQDVAGLLAAAPAYRESLSNERLDQRWIDRCNALDLGDAASAIIRTGWEDKHPEPLFIDRKTLAPIAAVDRTTNAPWALCTDDALLTRKGLPAYSTSLSRHLYQPVLADASAFVAVNDAPAGDDEAARQLIQSLRMSDSALAINPGGGLMMIRPLAPISYEDYADTLSGTDVPGSTDGVLRDLASHTGGELADLSLSGWITPGAGNAARLAEIFHLKVRLFAEAVGAARSAASSSGGPLLNISADSFRVRLGDGGVIQGGKGPGGLPLWWTAKVALVAPGEGVELPITGTDARYFLPGSERMSIYAPASAGRSVHGRGSIRIRRVVDAATGSSGGTPGSAAGVAFGTVLEGTLSTQERIVAGTNDLLWLRFSLAGQRIDVHATLDTRPGMNAGEIRLRTIAKELPAAVVERLRQAEGVPIPDVMFELVPLLSTPCDLYALGVLGVRTLLVNPGTTLPVALDELMSLAAQVSHEGVKPGGGDSLASRIAAAFGRDPRWAEALGPQRLVADKMDAASLEAALPVTLWHEVLAALIKMFPGVGATAWCKDFGDAPANACERVFDGPLADLYALLVKSRALLVGDQVQAREIREVVREALARV
ncbi:MAG: hypothetical protein SFY96_00610 [Planctomycetota bacterium]|nr:hypothetical protein [Planctomycetota bacterium]